MISIFVCSCIAGFGMVCPAVGAQAENAGSVAETSPQNSPFTTGMLADCVPDIVSFSELEWPTCDAALLGLVKTEWDAWRTARQTLKERARQDCSRSIGTASEQLAPAQRAQLGSVVASLQSRMREAEQAFGERLKSIGLPEGAIPEVLCRARRQAWLARNVASGIRAVCGRDRDVFETNGWMSGATGTSILPEYSRWCSADRNPIREPDGMSAAAQSHLISEAEVLAALAEFDSVLLQADSLLYRRHIRYLENQDMSVYRGLRAKLDRLQERFADRIQEALGGDSLSALQWRHEDRSGAFPSVTARGIPDKLFEIVIEWASSAASSDAAEDAKRSMLTFATKREHAERAIVAIMLRDPRRGLPIPAPNSASVDPDFGSWNRAIQDRLAAGNECMKQLLAILPQEKQDEAMKVSAKLTPAEAKSWFAAIPRP